MFKYRVRWGDINKIEIERETEKQVVLSNGKREAKRSDWTNYFDTWEDAKAFCVEKAQNEVDSLRLQLERAKGHLGNMKGLKNSTNN